MARRTLGKLSTARVRTAKPKSGRRALMLGDGGNLYLQATVTADGSVNRSWLFRYEIDGRRREMGLGPTHTVSLVEAREQARTLRQQLLDDIDPLAARQARRQAAAAESARRKTFRECAEDFIAAHADGWRNPKHRAQWTSSLATYAYPVLGSLAVSDIEVAHVLRVLEPIWRTVPETASRVRGRIEKVLGYATVRGYRHGDNPARWVGHLAGVLPAKGKIKKVEHHAALPYPEMPTFMAALRGRNSVSARALEFLILTACRNGEVVGATWDEIDLKAKTWTIPAARMKSAREHRVPLSQPALAVIEHMATARHDARVFPCSKTAVLDVTRNVRSGCVPHGFRSSFRDWASEQTAFPHEVCEQALAHTISNAVERAYRRGDLFDKRRRLMQAWADFCGKPIGAGATVTPLRKASADA